MQRRTGLLWVIALYLAVVVLLAVAGAHLPAPHTSPSEMFPGSD